MNPLVIVAFGIASVLFCIIVLRLHALLSLLLAALITSLLTSQTQISDYAIQSGLSEANAESLSLQTIGVRLSNAFGNTVGKVGILILLASLIGTALMKSGGAERIIRSLMALVGKKNASLAFLSGSFVLGIPVFFDTVFYLMIPLVKAIGIRNPKYFSLYLMCAIAGGVMTHSLVPPTPGPLYVAKELNVDIGVMMIGGLVLGMITVACGYLYALWANKKWDLPLRDTPDISIEELKHNAEIKDQDLPSLWWSLLPIVLPIVLITCNTYLGMTIQPKNTEVSGFQNSLLTIFQIIGDANIALFISAAIALYLMGSRLKNRKLFEKNISESLMSAGMIILITSAGGAFGQMLQQTGIGAEIGALANGYQTAILPLAFLITLVVRTAQGSATVAMVTAVGVMNGFSSGQGFGFHPVYLAIVIGCGSKIFPWMNDSAFWVITKCRVWTKKKPFDFLLFIDSHGLCRACCVHDSCLFLPFCLKLAMQNTIIKTTPSDNVGIVTNPLGLAKGTAVLDNLILTQHIPMGHKVALENLPKGAAVIRYGQTIGFTTTDIPRGAWINETNMAMPQPPDLESIVYEKPPHKATKPLTGYTFQGFRNADGSVGTKNVLGITISVQCVAGMTNYITQKIKKELLPLYPNVDDVVAFNHHYGCGIAIDAPAAMVPIKTIRHIAQNPNFGNEVMIVGLGCEKLRPERLLPNTDQNDSHSILYLQDEAFSGFEAMVAGIMDLADKHLKKLNQRQRETCPASDLVVGMQCGGSDAFSGLTGNPAAGFAADLIVRAGGTVLFSEVTEVRDAIHLLVPRAADEAVAQALKTEMAWYDNYLSNGQADRSANTTPGNKKGGLSNIVEKASLNRQIGYKPDYWISYSWRDNAHRDSILRPPLPAILYVAHCNFTDGDNLTFLLRAESTPYSFVYGARLLK
ncbi:MAG: SLC13 family permease [Spirosomataceae bacterium]